MSQTPPSPEPVCGYAPRSNEPCAECPRQITALYRCGLLQEGAQDADETDVSTKAPDYTNMPVDMLRLEAAALDGWTWDDRYVTNKDLLRNPLDRLVYDPTVRYTDPDARPRYDNLLDSLPDYVNNRDAIHTACSRLPKSARDSIVQVLSSKHAYGVPGGDWYDGYKDAVFHTAEELVRAYCQVVWHLRFKSEP